MTEYIPDNIPFEKRGYYPHMKPNDVAIWERFITAYPDNYDYCQYDVLVGSDPAFDTTVTPDTGGDAWKLYQKKIDVVGFKGERIDIIELKPSAGASAVGQVLMYKKLYKKDYTPPTEPRCIIITDKVNPDTSEFAEDSGVKVIVV